MKVLAILNIVMGSLGVLVAIIFLAIFTFGGAMVGMAAQQDPDAAIALPIIGALGTGLFVLILLCSLPGVIAGIGLLKYQPWARILTIVLSGLNLLNVPLGTALGIYGLWVLLNSETERLFYSVAVAPPQYPPPT